MLHLQKLSVSIEEKSILREIDFSFKNAGITAILGHNGSGKSSLALSLMGHPKYEISGKILLENEDISELSPSERHHKGIFLSFQNIPEIPGIQVIEYLRTIYNTHFSRENPDEKAPSLFVFKRMVEKLLPELHIEKELLERELFVGFSGGEKRKIELLQISLLNPKIIILDEIDSGLDIDAISVLQDQINKWKNLGKTIIIISHNLHLLEHINIDEIIIMKDGKIIETGEKNLLKKIKEEGFTN